MATKIEKSKSYKIIKEVNDSDKCPPQAKVILEAIKAAGGQVGRKELVELLGRPAAEGGLTTRQSADRILSFYRPKLIAMGVLEEVAVETEVEVPDPPAAEPKAAKEPKPAKAKSAKGKKGAKVEEASTEAEAA